MKHKDRHYLVYSHEQRQILRYAQDDSGALREMAMGWNIGDGGEVGLRGRCEKRADTFTAEIASQDRLGHK